MKLTKEQLVELYQQRSNRPSSRASCLTEEELARATAGELSQPENKCVAAHLMTCGDCAEEYRLVRPLKAFAEGAAAALADPSSAQRQQAAGAEIQPRKRTRGTLAPWWQRPGMILSPARVAYAIAAALVIISVVLGAWIVSLRRDNQQIIARLDKEGAERNQTAASASQSLEEANQHAQQDQSEIARLRDELSRKSVPSPRPELNVTIIDLDPRDSNRGSTQRTVKTIEVPRGTNYFTLILNVSGEPSFRDYALEIVNRNGKVSFEGKGLRRSPYNTFTVALPKSFLSAGQYQIKLFGVKGASKEMVQDYTLRIHYK